MKVVGIREIKNRLSEYVRLVRQGEAVLLTDRGKVVARLDAADRAGADAGMDLVQAALASRGGVTLGEPNDPDVYEVLRPLLRKRTSAELLDEERGVE